MSQWSKIHTFKGKYGVAIKACALLDTAPFACPHGGSKIVDVLVIDRQFGDAKYAISTTRAEQLRVESKARKFIGHCVADWPGSEL